MATNTTGNIATANVQINKGRLNDVATGGANTATNIHHLIIVDVFKGMYEGRRDANTAIRITNRWLKYGGSVNAQNTTEIHGKCARTAIKICNFKKPCLERKAKTNRGT